jgi:hypothetical protein
MDEDEPMQPAVGVTPQTQQQVDIISVLKESQTAGVSPSSLDDDDDDKEKSKDPTSDKTATTMKKN